VPLEINDHLPIFLVLVGAMMAFSCDDNEVFGSLAGTAGGTFFVGDCGLFGRPGRIGGKKKPPSLPTKQPPPTLPKPKGYSPPKPSPLTLPPPKLDIPDSLSPTGPDKKAHAQNISDMEIQ
jgi:hypothetical protein